MLQKNYYQILQVSPQASAAEIKTAYRMLAIKYHPDKNNGDTINEAIFKEINEAYSILSNVEKRKLYNAQRALHTQSYRPKQQIIITSQTLVQQAAKIKANVEKSNVFTIDRDALYFKINGLLSEHHINILLSENNKHVKGQFVRTILACLQPLPFENIRPLFARLKKISLTDEVTLTLLRSYYHDKKQEAVWQRYKIWVVLIVAMLLCCAMYLLYG